MQHGGFSCSEDMRAESTNILVKIWVKKKLLQNQLSLLTTTTTKHFWGESAAAHSLLGRKGGKLWHVMSQLTVSAFHKTEQRETLITTSCELPPASTQKRGLSALFVEAEAGLCWICRPARVHLSRGRRRGPSRFAFLLRYSCKRAAR